MRCDPEGIVEAAMTAYALGDYETAASFYSPDATFAIYADNEIYPFAGEWRGRGAIVECWQQIDATFEILRFDVRNIKTVGDVTTCQVHYELCHRQTGERLDGTARSIFDVRDGQIIREREYNDVERMRAFMRFVEHSGTSAAEVNARRA